MAYTQKTVDQVTTAVRNGMTQTQAAKKFKISPFTVGNWMSKTAKRTAARKQTKATTASAEAPQAFTPTSTLETDREQLLSELRAENQRLKLIIADVFISCR